MFSNFTIGLIAGLGFAGWVYSKVMRSSGGNTQNSLIVAGAAGIGAMIVITSLLGFIIK